MNIRPIRTENDYQLMRAEVSRLFDDQPDPGTDAGDRFEVMLTLVDSYESKHHAIATPDPIAAIEFRMAQDGMSVRDLGPYIGPTNRAYEVLNRTRPLTLQMMRRVMLGMGISGDVLLRQEAAVKPKSKGPARPRARPRASAQSGKRAVKQG